uniref:Uncharacterized protein n=1 Tax=Rhipicephalus appendiculatus TaxID=34631 RepID=A0A131YF64_RHIAP
MGIKILPAESLKAFLMSHGTTKVFNAAQVTKQVLDNQRVQIMAFLGYKVHKSKHTTNSTNIFFLPLQAIVVSTLFHICARVLSDLNFLLSK